MSKNKTVWIVLVVLSVTIKIFSLFPAAVEKYYSTGIYPAISQTLRILFGWIPFSIGDILYGAVIIILVYKLTILVKKLIKRKTNKQYWWGALRGLVFVALWVYVLFNGLWGLNYNRQGISTQLELKIERYTTQDLVNVMDQLVVRLNALDSSAHLNRISIRRKRNLFEGAQLAYDSLTQQRPEFEYVHSSVKPSLYSYLGNYLGYTGYYNPFSGEAQVNTTVPLFVQPFTTCHEIGHQLGYAKENEANFAGYLSARSSSNPAFLYSVYFDLYSYSRFYLYMQDSALSKQMDSRLPAGFKKDYRELQEFVIKHRNPLERVIDKLYGQYLKANEQPAGRLTYNEVVAWLVAYYKKFGKEAI
jgi:Protein of unknown function (DUF3810)